MTNKDLRKLRRADLLEILVEQGHRMEMMQKELDEANKELRSRHIAISKSGSIAEAALRLNHIFEDAENAARQYVENVAAAKPGAATVLNAEPDEESRKRSEQLLVATARKCKAMEEATAKKCLEMIEQAKRVAARIENENEQDGDV